MQAGIQQIVILLKPHKLLGLIEQLYLQAQCYFGVPLGFGLVGAERSPITIKSEIDLEHFIHCSSILILMEFMTCSTAFLTGPKSVQEKHYHFHLIVTETFFNVLVTIRHFSQDTCCKKLKETRFSFLHYFNYTNSSSKCSSFKMHLRYI